MTLHTVDLDETGWLLDTEGGSPVPADRLDEHFARELTPPSWATDILVYAHGWQTSPKAAAEAARRLTTLAEEGYAARPALYPALGDRFAPWTVVVRWPSRSGPLRRGYRMIRSRAHALSADGGHAPRVIGQLLDGLNERRADPSAARVLANRAGQYVHLVGHSFGCRVLCEAVQWAAGDRPGQTLGWSRPAPAGRPFTVDSMLLLQMAAPRNAFETMFAALADAPLHGPVVATHSRRDWATGLWHKLADQRRGIGSRGIGRAPEPVSAIRMLPPDEPYPKRSLDHWFVSVDAGEVFTAGWGPSGAHSDHLHPETAHLLLSLANHSRSEHGG
ncbi:hypothetical protein GCM10010387_08520 [Streptomyces inusitatus]|uniref:Alpha/beta hydrolase n=1 Tax=Streptomyces inusitatus TaxID=68221 RepID=A0A918ULA1_9ACTN|nr:hypothetical protein [Streptomyces inusitatus]GGZ18339.1 hypothetical protein GCM10010387_08520 [Streptomyces inusitatus]